MTTNVAAHLAILGVVGQRVRSYNKGDSMVTQEERRKLESEWSSDDQALAALGRVVKGTVLMVLVLGLAFLAAGPGTLDNARYASETERSQPSNNMGEGSALNATRQVFDERRANWQQNLDARQRTASR